MLLEKHVQLLISQKEIGALKFQQKILASKIFLCDGIIITDNIFI